MDDLQETTNGEIGESWQIVDDQAAEWALSKIKEAEAECQKWTDYYTGMIEKIRQKTSNTVDFMQDKLEQYFKTVPHKDTATTEKYNLPSGDLIMKKPKAVWVRDDEALLKWCEENGFSECVNVKKSVAWSKVKPRLKVDSNGVICDSETGLVCDAVKAQTSEPEFVLNIK